MADLLHRRWKSTIQKVTGAHHNLEMDKYWGLHINSVAWTQSHGEIKKGIGLIMSSFHLNFIISF